ncbi:hypothetical protein [Candidatus Poriferisocius sp.]|uniref:hypothetical protein n=1 Tax=Candidatus Poriferisocius sp. TaxID=3101276 RepID=UPI003B028305
MTGFHEHSTAPLAWVGHVHASPVGALSVAGGSVKVTVIDAVAVAVAVVAVMVQVRVPGSGRVAVSV